MITDTLTASSVVYSFGIGEDVSFDIALIDRFGITVHAFDPTPRSIQWARSAISDRRFVLHEYGLASSDGIAMFRPPENPAYVSHTMLRLPPSDGSAIALPVRRLSTIVRELGHQTIDVLKMDIEGAEYEVIEDLQGTALRPLQVLVEFHHRFSNVGPQRTKDSVECLRSMGYKLFFVSPSNEEFCFVHQDA